eukprot:699468-Rhodomonas_salina.4
MEAREIFEVLFRRFRQAGVQLIMRAVLLLLLATLVVSAARALAFTQSPYSLRPVRTASALSCPARKKSKPKSAKSRKPNTLGFGGKTADSVGKVQHDEAGVEEVLYEGISVEELMRELGEDGLAAVSESRVKCFAVPQQTHDSTDTDTGRLRVSPRFEPSYSRTEGSRSRWWMLSLIHISEPTRPRLI